MQVKRLSLALVALVAIVGCGDRSRSKSGQTDFVTSADQSKHNRGGGESFDQKPEGNSSPAGAAEAHGDKSVDKSAQQPPEEARNEAAPQPKNEPLIVKGEATNSMTAYKIPDKLEQRLKQSHPELVPARTEKFDIRNQHLHISTKTSLMTFTGVLRIAGKPDEPLELRCKFDQSEPAWSCDNMFPVDPKVAAERRLQATAHCLDTLECQRVAVELFVVINGKTESQHFQNQKFQARRASSGDVEEAEDETVTKEDLKPPTSKKPPKVYEKPRPTSEPAKTVQPEEEDVETEPELSENQIESVMNNPNEALEISAPIPMPTPGKGKYSIPGVEKLRPADTSGVKAQAIGFHSAGHLKASAELPDQGPGFLCRQRKNRNFGTDSTIAILKLATESVEKNFKNRPPIVIANISQKTGGRLCGQNKCHGSHQTGLDVDIGFPSSSGQTGLWSACGRNSRCGKGAVVVREFDEERFWHFTKQLVCAKDGEPVIAMFLATEIKNHMCAWARQNAPGDLRNSSSCGFRALQAMKYWPGHHDHVHVRFRCPGNRECRNATVSLARGTGC